MKRSAFAILALLALTATTTACPPLDAVAPSGLATGTTPNAVAVVRCETGPRLLVTASAEGRLDVLDPAGAAPPSSIFLGVSTLPWDVAVVRHADADGVASDEATRAVVTLAGTHGVAVVRPCGGAAGRLFWRRGECGLPPE